MRPINLKISAFGPYAGCVDIPMRELGREGLYLITGDTGAGKTTIFDAICFALFGEASGSNREASMLRSKYANADIETYVELTFMHGEKEYVVRRTPEYMRPSKRGGKEVKQVSDAVLTFPDGSVITKTTDVTASVEKLLGINREQFSQIAMLAQGEFLKLLISSTKDRQAIFRELFRTGYYQKLQIELENRRKELFIKCEDERKSLKQYILDIAVDENSLRSLEVNKARQDELPLEDILLLIEDILKEDRNIQAEIDKKLEGISKTLEGVNKELGTIKALDDEYKKAVLDKEGLHNTRKSLQDKALKYEKQIEEKNAEIKELSNEKEYLKDAGLNIEKLNNLLRILEEEKIQLDELSEEYDTYVEKGKALEASKEEYIKLEAAYKEKELEYIEKESMFRAGMAGILASRLEEGKPCPVCGSIEHVMIAKKPDYVPTEDELDELRSVADGHKDNVSKQSSICGNLSGEIKNLEEILCKQASKTLSCENIKDIPAKLENISREKEEKIKEISNQLADEKQKSTRKDRIESLLPKAEEQKGLLEKSISEIKGQLAQLNESEKSLTVKAQELEKKIKNEEKEELNLKRKTLEDEQNDEIKRSRKVGFRIETNEKCLSLISKKSKDVVIAEKNLASITTLSNTASGKLSGKEKIMLETYIQTTYFDRIIERANIKFMKMSDGQYELKRLKEASNGKSQSGLELSVVDHYNGSERSVKSLSGGESFMASLSLALGLSEEVQLQAGGIVIETMFVDEGFGSLDSDSLELVYKSLSSLTEGNRLVGIISHVEDMKLRIDKQIVVKKSKQGGSSVSLLIG